MNAIKSLVGLSIVFCLVFCICALAQSPTSTSTTVRPEEYKLDPIATGTAPYPPQAREGKIEGEVIAMMAISETGEVSNVQVIKGDQVLRKAVEDTVSQWKFKPIIKDDKAIPVIGKATFTFALSDAAQVASGVPGAIGPATERPTRVRVSSGVSVGLLLSKTAPVYPEDARRARIQGAVLLRAVIDREGNVSQLDLIAGPPELVPAAMEAVKRWRYKPYLFMGAPVEVETQILVNFTLSR
jgi:TonB family protein